MKPIIAYMQFWLPLCALAEGNEFADTLSSGLWPYGRHLVSTVRPPDSSVRSYHLPEARPFMPFSTLHFMQIKSYTFDLRNFEHIFSCKSKVALSICTIRRLFLSL